jgi:hypothetical protein
LMSGKWKSNTLREAGKLGITWSSYTQV